MSHGLLLALIILSSNASGFWVGYATSSIACEFIIDKSQTSFICEPSISSRYCFLLSHHLDVSKILHSSFIFSIVSFVSFQRFWSTRNLQFSSFFALSYKYFGNSPYWVLNSALRHFQYAIMVSCFLAKAVFTGDGQP